MGLAVQLVFVPNPFFIGARRSAPRRRRRAPARAARYPAEAPAESLVGLGGGQWVLRADDLATAFLRLANRTDCCGGYRRTTTTRKCTDDDWVPLDRALRYHCTGMRVVGLHAIAPDNTAKWLAFDLDAHNGESAAGNLVAAQELAARLRREGLAPYIFDSDGRGGIHVWAMFDAPRPSPEAFALARRMAADLPVPVEAFPKQPDVGPDRPYGNWIRLPGKHHRHAHWSRLWTDDGWASPEATVAAVIRMCVPA